MKVSSLFSKNKVFTLIFSVTIIIFFIGIIGNQLIDLQIKNWSETTNKNVKEIEEKSKIIINNYQNNLVAEKEKIIKKLKNIKDPTFKDYEEIVHKLEFEEQKIAVFKNDELFIWDKHFLENLIPNDSANQNYNETYFLDSGINTYLVIRDTFNINNDLYELFLAQIIEKQYQLNEDYFKEISLTKDISEIINSDFKINILKNAAKTKDGRKHSFEINNNKNNLIGIATFVKPSRESSVVELENLISSIQSLIVLTGFIILGFLLKYELDKFSNEIIKIISISIYLIILRYILIFIEFPKIILKSVIVDEKYYYSDFGLGLTNSPLDLFFTLLVVLIIFWYILKFSIEFYKRDKRKNSTNFYWGVLTLIIGMIIYLISLRGFGASIRSFVFDTSIRYFQSTSLNLTIPHLIMHINVLIIGIVSIIGSAIILFFILTFFKSLIEKNRIQFFIILFCIFVVSEIFYSFQQNNPQLTIPIKIFQIFLVFVIVYITIIFDYKRITKLIIYFLAASVFSIISLLFYNTELEKASLKTTANIIARVDESWYKTLIYETLLADFSRAEALTAFSSENSNYNSAAFKIWSKSNLQKESINSSVNFISLSRELLGGFGSTYPRISLDRFIDTNSVIEEIQIFEEPYENESQKLIRGIFPVKDEFAFLGYIDISILSDLNDFGFSTHPEFISTGKLNEKAILKLDKLIILDYRNQDLKIVYGNFTPNQEINQTILDAEFTSKNDAWIESEIDNSKLIIYVKRIYRDNIERILAVALRGKELSIGLFDFFKVFFTHAIILIIIILIYFLYYYKKETVYQFDLRSKLLVAFLIISLLPLILTAYYFRNLTEEKNEEAIYYKLGKRAFNVETYLNDNANGLFLYDLYNKASRDLNINYTIYRQNILEYSSQDLLYDVGLMPKIINPDAYEELQLNGSQEILVKEYIEKYEINSFYYKANFLGEDIIVKVADGFNKIQLPLSGSEVDVLLFGFYSLAVVLIIIFSAIFANQISLPIRKITSATRSVAAGDLSLEIKTNAKGELGDLVSGFQYMIRELKRNQTILAEIEREEAWKEMAKQVAHEIKNPLTPMKLSVQQLITAYNDKSEKFDSFFKKVTETILNQIETLKNIATEFSNFARMPKLKVEKINSADVILQSINLFTDENIKITFNNNSTNTFINGDSEQLKRAIINMIRNSIQANATDIELNLNDNNSNLELRVKDNGNGIDADNIERIFEANFTTKKEGMGLGLSMAKRYLKSTGADIFVEKTSSDGTIIIMTFPKIV
ncbi:MAG: ATP-binding protein [Ignavibacteriae bacterium]|nr:ATP-binding protein [Ignavibacteriota bacterium]